MARPYWKKSPLAWDESLTVFAKPRWTPQPARAQVPVWRLTHSARLAARPFLPEGTKGSVKAQSERNANLAETDMKCADGTLDGECGGCSHDVKDSVRGNRKKFSSESAILVPMYILRSRNMRQNRQFLQSVPTWRMNCTGSSLGVPI